MIKKCRDCGNDFNAIGKAKTCIACQKIRNFSPTCYCRKCGTPISGKWGTRYCMQCGRPRTYGNPDKYKDKCPLCGQPKLKQSKHCHHCNDTVLRIGNKGTNWKGGKFGHPDGYIFIYNPDTRGHMPEHRFVWEKANGKIPPGHLIHHLNGIKSDNRLENLVISTPKEHNGAANIPFLLEMQQRIRDLEQKVRDFEAISHNSSSTLELL